MFDFVWIDDFAAARNEALSHATGDYAFWLDADDVVKPAEREKLRVLFGGLRRPTMGDATSAMSSSARGNSPPGTANGAEGDGAAFVMRCACPPGADGMRGGTVVDHVRLFPIRPGVRWTYRVHEQILPSLNRAKIPARWTDIVIRHDGYADPLVEARKLERNIKILERELIERPDDSFVLFNLGASAVQQKQYHAALGLPERSLALSAPRDSIVRKLYAMIARVHQMTGNSQEAIRTCAEGLKLDPEDAELWHRKGVVHHHRGESSEAERCWRRILDLKRPDLFCSFDQGIYGHVTRRNLAVLASERGEHAEGRRLWEAVLVECPGDQQGLDILARPRVSQARVTDRDDLLG